jgi:aspergillopepsin I
MSSESKICFKEPLFKEILCLRAMNFTWLQSCSPVERLLTPKCFTGSADLWVFSDLMPTSESEGHTVYGPDASSSATLFSGQTFDISYGSGSASGAVYSETLTIGSTDGSFTIGGYPLEAATDASDSFTSAYAMSGLFGLDMSTTQLQGPTSEITYMYFLDAYVGSKYYPPCFHHQDAILSVECRLEN